MDEMTLDEFDEPKGLWGRLKDKFVLGSDEEEEDLDARGPRQPRKSVPLKMHSARINRVSVWHAAESFDTARQVADGLKDGHPQVVNLENTKPELAERIIDFLNGVTYALDGYVEKVGHKVFFFTPSNMVIDVEESSQHKHSLFTGG
ncbi:MAG: cell division protein SepF [Armatimonadota bacterium]